MELQRRRHRTRGLAVAFVAVALPALVAGCGDDAADTPSTTTTVASSGTSATTTPGSSSDAPADAPADVAAKVNANDATVDELTAAFEAAGVPNAERWAHEVEEYRPYTDDGWAHLRQELSKYNIDEATFDRIVATLEL